MAEAVQRHLEATATELDEMERLGIFSKDHINIIKRQRKEYEYKLAGPMKQLQDYVEYINFEKACLKKLKSNVTKMSKNERRVSVQYKMIHRVKALYEIALDRFPKDLALNLSYFKFCKKCKSIVDGTKAIEKLTKNFPDNPEVWKMSASWHAYDRKDVNTALNFVLKGLAIHKKNEKLYSKAVEFEVRKVIEITEEHGENSLEQKAMTEMCCKKLQMYFQAIFVEVDKLEFVVDLLAAIATHSFTLPVQDFVIKEMLDNHSDKSIVWDTIAQREKNGLFYGNITENMSKSTKSCLERCFKRYEEGLTKVSESEKKPLWLKYLDCLIDLQENARSASVLRRDSLRSALEKADEDIDLDERYYVAWIETCQDDDEVEKILKRANQKLPLSVELWKLRLKFAIMKDVRLEINQVFKMGYLALQEKSLPLWLMTIRYHTLTSSTDFVETIYLDGIETYEEISDALKPLYLEWVSVEKDIQRARAVYNRISQLQPYCKELHKVMNKIEMLEVQPDLAKWEEVHKNACNQFGVDHIDVWLDYLKWQVQFNKTKNLASCISKLSSRAKQTLREELKEEFVRLYQQTMAELEK